MPPYNARPFGPKLMLDPGRLCMSFGGYNDGIPNTQMLVTSVAISGANVATLGVTVIEGNIPAVGSLISVEGTRTATSGGAPNFNVTNAPLTAVSINATTGIGTVSFALTSTTIATTPDAGVAIVLTPITQESLPAAATAGQQWAIPNPSGGNFKPNISWFTLFASAPGAVTALFQVADVDLDSNYTTFDTSSNVNGETRSVGNVEGGFCRIKLSGSGGTTCAAGIRIG